jgi:hypothetical protein
MAQQFVSRALGCQKRNDDQAAVASAELGPRPEIAEHMIDSERPQRSVLSDHSIRRARRVVPAPTQGPQHVNAPRPPFRLRTHQRFSLERVKTVLTR